MANPRVLWLGGLIGAFFCLLAYAQEAEPPAPATNASPTPSVAPVPEASPEPSATPLPPPENAAPDLLPESQALPAPTSPPPPSPRDLLPTGPVPQALWPPNQPSATQRLKDVIRFREIRTLAERDPYAVWLWRTADQATTIEGKREYLRAYYRYTAAQMRKLEPRLNPRIKTYEFGRLAAVTQVNIRPTIALYELDRNPYSANRNDRDRSTASGNKNSRTRNE